MKQLILLTFILAITAGIASSETVTITNSGTTFTPDEVTVNVGDTVVFTLGGSHNAVEVSLETYNANGNTSNGGFQLGFGGGSVAFPTAGTYYYVCEPHASLGMKGIIHVQSTSSIDKKEDNVGLSVFPNPVVNSMEITFFLNSPSQIEIELVNMTGSRVETILNDFQEAGEQKIHVDLTDNITSGIYFIRVKTDEDEFVKKILIK